ncbi:MAG TPA: HNH endonuclease signature motif containing protein [Polyangiaceae bacterium]
MNCKACAYGAEKKRIELRRGAGAFPPLPIRFWSKVQRGATGECWPFQGVRDHKGYGRFHTKDGGRLAHRMAWELVHGPPSIGLCAMHTCDNPTCCNPSHLRLGTDAENRADKLTKGRHLFSRKGLDPDTERSVRVVSILGIRHVENAALHGISSYRVAKALGLRCG